MVQEKGEKFNEIELLSQHETPCPLTVPPGKGIAEDDKKLDRKVKPKTCYSRTRTTGKTSSASTKTSKYFQSPLKEEDADSRDDFDMETSPPYVVKLNPEKTEEKEEKEEYEEAEEDSEEDEDDWEEVEGKLLISRKHRQLVA